MKPNEVSKNVDYLKNFKLASSTSRIIKLTAGAGLALVGGYIVYRVYKDTNDDLTKLEEEALLDKDLYEDEN